MYTACMLSGLVAKTVRDTVLESKHTPRIVQWGIESNEFVCHKSKSDSKNIGKAG